MKLIAFFLLTAILHMCTPALSQRVSISGKNLTLEQVFMEIKKQTGMEFIYESALLKAAHPITLNVQKMPVAEVLQRCLQGQGLGFNIRSNTIIIFIQEDGSQVKEAVTDNTVLITGHVTDAQGQPVEMASVVLGRTNAGTQTNRLGSFTLKIKNPLPNDSLIISFVGLKSYSLQPGNRTDLGQIILQLADNVLDETIIRAYGATSERFRTGDITMVKATDIEKMPALNVVEALAGRVVGLNVWQNSSFASSVYNIQLRGVNIIPTDGTVTTKASTSTHVLSKPLIVVNGLPMAPDVVTESSVTGSDKGLEAITGITGAGGGHDILYSLNPFDIESISVLKDAEATALYGSRAANGVIIITSKKGKPGKTALNITVNTGVNVQAKRLKLLNTQQYLAMRNEAWNNTIRANLPVSGVGGISYRPNLINAYDLLLWDTTRYTDWQKVLFGSAPNTNAHLELSGGGKHTTYRLGAGYNNSRASYPTLPGKDAFREERSTLSANVSTHSRNNRFKWATTVSAASSFSNQPGNDVFKYIFLAPDAPAMLDADGNLNYAQWHTGANCTSMLTGNPMESTIRSYRSDWLNLQAGSLLSYEVLQSLVFSINTGYTGYRSNQRKILPPSSSDPTIISSVRRSDFGKSTDYGLILEPSLRYEHSLDRHHLVLLGGGSFQLDRQKGNVTNAWGYTSDQQMSGLAGATSYSYSYNVVERRSLSAWGRVSYQYAGKYLSDVSIRRDGSSSFGPGRRYGNFGSVGLGWIFTEESWGKNIPLLTFGKLRGSYGITGSQNADPYAYHSTFTPAQLVGTGLPTYSSVYFTNGIYDGVPALTLTRVANRDLSWAQANSVDVGIDLYFLTDQRLKCTVQWYREIIGNQFVISPVSSVTGSQSLFVENTAAQVENRGLEATIDYRSPVRRSGINWDIHFNIAANQNKLLAYPGLENVYINSYYEVGQPLMRQELYASFLNTKSGIYQYTDSAHPSPISYYAINNPAFTGGLQTGISWKGLSLSISCVYAKQKGFTNMQGALLPGNLGPTGLGNQPVSIVQHKQPGGAFYAGTVSNNLTMDIYWGDASYITIKNASLNYRLPETLLGKWNISGMSFYLNAENLLLLSRGYKGANPEQATLTTTQMPLRKILVTGFTINI